jgi:hypothetical protein
MFYGLICVKPNATSKYVPDQSSAWFYKVCFRSNVSSTTGCIYISFDFQLPGALLTLPVFLCLLSMLIADSIPCSLIIPFLRLGEAVTGSGHFPLTSDALKNVLTGHASKELLMSVVHAVSGQLHLLALLIHRIEALLYTSL